MTRALACAPKCNCRTCRIRRMDSLSVGIPSPPSIATGERWSQVNIDLRDDLRSQRPSLPPGLRESHIRGMICQVPALEEAVETKEAPGDGLWSGWLVAAGRVAGPPAEAADDPGEPRQAP